MKTINLISFFDTPHNRKLMNATRYCTECEIELTDDNTNNKDDTTCDECFSKIMNDTDCEYSNFQEDQDMDNYYENKYGR